jgi:Right handed beta helix region
LPIGKFLNFLLENDMSRRILVRTALTFIASLLISATATAGLFRSYLSVTGNDTNPCTVNLPCRLLPAALAAVNSGGEIWMLDSANFNTSAVSITKSVSILAVPGALGSVVGNQGDAFDISTAGIDVSLRNLKIVNLAAGPNGIMMSDGNSLTVSDCEITGFSNAGIYVTTPSTVTVSDTVLRGNYAGAWFDHGVFASLSRTTAVDNTQVGIWARATTGTPINVTVTDSVASGNGIGIESTANTTYTAKVTVTRSTATNNGSGFLALGTGTSIMVVSGSSASGNNTGFQNASGTFQTLSDNTVINNIINDAVGTISTVAHW